MAVAHVLYCIHEISVVFNLSCVLKLHSTENPELSQVFPFMSAVGMNIRSKHIKGSKERYLLGQKYNLQIFVVIPFINIRTTLKQPFNGEN